MLQSVFIIRSYNDLQLRDNSSIELVAASLAASLFSITNKYIWLDEESVEGHNADDPKWRLDFPCVNPWYVLRVIWRFSFVATRFCVLSLIWSVLGGAFLGIFLGASFILWACTFCVKDIFGEGDQFEDHCLLAFAISMAWGGDITDFNTIHRVIFICMCTWIGNDCMFVSDNIICIY